MLVKVSREINHHVKIHELSNLAQIVMSTTVSQILHHLQNRSLRSLTIHHWIANPNQRQYMITISINIIPVHSYIIIHTFINQLLLYQPLPITINIKHFLMPSRMPIITLTMYILIYINNNSFIHIHIHILSISISQ